MCTFLLLITVIITFSELPLVCKLLSDTSHRPLKLSAVCLGGVRVCVCVQVLFTLGSAWIKSSEISSYFYEACFKMFRGILPDGFACGKLLLCLKMYT